MKKLTRLFLLLIAVCCFQQSPLAQATKIDDVLLVEVRDMGAIKEGDLVTGYYLFYKTDKAKKGYSSFELKILDTELNEVMVKKMNYPNSTSLMSASSNGESILFKFWQGVGKETKLKFKGYDYKGESVISKGITIRERAEQGMYQSMGAYLNVFGTAAIPGYGYVEYMPKKYDKMSYQIKYIPSNDQTTAWTKKGSTSKVESAQYLCTIDSTLISVVNSREKTMSAKDINFLIEGVNIKTGKEIFSSNLQEQGLNALVINGTPSLDGENIVMYGLYYPEGEKVTKKSTGLIKIIIDKNGKVIDDFKLSWEEDFKLATEEEKDLGNIHFHEFVYGEDGKTYLIAEQFGLNTGGTLLSAALSGGKGGSAYKINDLLVIELNKDFKVEKIEVIKKSQNSYVAPGISIASSQTIGYMIDYYGWFDFSYLQNKEKLGEFTIGYVNFEKIKGEKNKLVFGGVTHTEGEYAYDKIPISVRGSVVRVMEGKPGYVCLMEYNKKEKTIDLRLEKINF